MKIAIFGTGGVGGYFGARLAQHGHDVTFIARGAHLQAIRTQGLHVESPLGDAHIHPAQATDTPAEVGPVDAVLVGVKAWQVPEAAQAMRPLVGAHTLVLPLQNGVEAPSQLAEVLGKEHVLGGMCKISSFIAAPGHIRHAGITPYIALGELDNRRTPRVEALHAALTGAGIQAEIPQDILVAMWGKLTFIAAFSAVGAVTRLPAGAWRQVPQTRAMLIAAMNEIVRVGQAEGVAVGEKTVQSALSFTDSVPEGATASMQRDIMEGRPSELEAQTGAVVRLGHKHAVPTPVNDFLYAALLPQEMQARAG
ncbi:MAG: 2-dehydropantoate 2-reductase [Anaerolineae bacterium]|nr:MAG: 2-dehydropantoate 2-reductase [Anaerolineae bacterium]